MTGDGHNTQEELEHSSAMQNLPQEDSASTQGRTCRAVPRAAPNWPRVCGDLALLGIAVEQHPLPPGARERFLKKNRRRSCGE